VLYKVRYELWVAALLGACVVSHKLWVAALLGACVVIQDVHHLSGHIGYYLKLEIVKTAELEKIYARHVECNIIKHIAVFLSTFCILFLPINC